MYTLPALAFFFILAGPAEKTLVQFTSQAEVEMLFSHEDVKGIRTQTVVGDYDPRTALAIMTAGAPLSVHWEFPRFVSITPDRYENPFTTAPVRVNGHDYTCFPLQYVIGMAYPRSVSLAYDLRFIERDSLYCTNERPIDPLVEPDQILREWIVSARAQRRPRIPFWGPRR